MFFLHQFISLYSLYSLLLSILILHISASMLQIYQHYCTWPLLVCLVVFVLFENFFKIIMDNLKICLLSVAPKVNFAMILMLSSSEEVIRTNGGQINYQNYIYINIYRVIFMISLLIFFKFTFVSCVTLLIHEHLCKLWFVFI